MTMYTDSGKTGKAYNKNGLLLIAILVFLLLAVSVLESLRYFAPVTIRTSSTTRKQHLPDGTWIVLNTDSKLTLNNNWKKEEDREAWLDGEAFFSVPIVQDTNGLAIHTPGFDVVAFQARLYMLNRNDTIRAWLQEGSAYILTHHSKPRKILFAPGDQVEYINRQIIKTQLKDRGSSAWKTSE